jgi:hypothetical protein
VQPLEEWSRGNKIDYQFKYASTVLNEVLDRFVLRRDMTA